MLNEQTLDTLLTTPSARLVEDMAKIKGDIMVIGAGGKMGPSLCVLAKNAVVKAGLQKRVIAVSRFSDPISTEYLKAQGVELIGSDLLEEGAVAGLPEIENVIFMAGRKFGTEGAQALTWAMNTYLPALVAEHFRSANIVAFSSGNVYPMVPLHSGGATEEVAPGPIGEYGMSCLGRERAFAYGAQRYNTPVLLYRLNYAVDLRYGVLYDIAKSILNDQPVSLCTPVLNCIWQLDANEIAIRSLLHTSPQVELLNVTGPETASVEHCAKRLATLLGRQVRFTGQPSEAAYLSNSGKAVRLFGYPTMGIEELIERQAEWILSGGRTLNKDTHFEERGGKY